MCSYSTRMIVWSQISFIKIKPDTISTSAFMGWGDDKRCVLSASQKVYEKLRARELDLEGSWLASIQHICI